MSADAIEDAAEVGVRIDVEPPADLLGDMFQLPMHRGRRRSSDSGRGGRVCCLNRNQAGESRDDRQSTNAWGVSRYSGR